MMRRSVALFSAAVLGLGASGAVCAQDQTADSAESRAAVYERVTEAVKPALVRVKFIMSMESMWGGESEEQEMEVDGVLISDDGMVLLGNYAMGGWMTMFSEVQVNPRDVKVMIGDDTEGVPATVVARDSDRDLCWIKLDEAPETPLPFLDLTASSGMPGVGEQVYQVKRLDEFFGRATVVSEGTVSAQLSKPRDLLYVGMSSIEPGLPAVRADGSFAGFAIIQSPSDEEMSMGGGFGGGAFGSMILAVLPAAEVASATDDAAALAEEE